MPVMQPLHYLEVENFKRFGAKQRIELGQSAVLVGPNNCGKTSMTQAIALWSHAVKTWFVAKGESPPKKRTATALNRLNIVAVPVPRTRCYWNDMVVRRGTANVHCTITAGVWHDDEVVPVEMRFRNAGDEIAYCWPGPKALGRLDAIETASKVNVELLYPMSGIEAEEPILQPGRVGVLLGQGQTAQVLRNLCMTVHQHSPEDWNTVAGLMKRLFSVELDVPAGNARGSIDLMYRQEGVKHPMDLSLAGRGLQQMLLLLAYLHLPGRNVLLVDEPDAHLEILRQRQAYVLLREVAARRASQVVMATHSEVMLDEAAAHGGVTLLVGGRAEPLPNIGSARQALRHYGAEHYVRAKQRGYALYVEGTTDFEILRAMAGRLEHPVADKWDERANVYYVRDNHPSPGLDASLERVERGYGMAPKEHFGALRGLVDGLRGLAILDCDAGAGRDAWSAPTGSADSASESLPPGLHIVRWRRYEIENYFVAPELLLRYVRTCYADHGQLDIFAETAADILDQLVLERVFDSNQGDLATWKNAGDDERRLIWNAKSATTKLSALAEEFFRRFAAQSDRPMLLRKSTLHRLVEHADPATLPPEVTEKLDLLEALFDGAEPGE